MNDALAAKWSVIRSKGKSRYIWLHGVVLWGWPTALLWTLFTCSLQGWDKISLYLPVALICFSIGGFVAGTWGWARHEHNYERRLAKPIA